MDKAIVYSAAAALCYGLGSPFWKVAVNHGASTTGIALAYGLTGAAICWFNGETTLFGSVKGFGYAMTVGMFFGIALYSVGRAFSTPTGYVSLIAIIVASYPLVSTAISLVFLGEADKFRLVPLLIGTMLIVAGLVLVTTSMKSPTH